MCDDPGSCAWVTDVPAGAWHLSGRVKQPPSLCLDTAAALHGVKVDTSPGERFERAIRMVAPGLPRDRVPWAYAIPRRDHVALVKRLVNSAHEVMDRVTLDYLATTWVDGWRALDRLVRVRVDVQLHSELIASETSGSVHAALASFTPGPDGLAPSVRYDRLATATGRLTVVEGPHVLTLRKDLRSVMVSRHGVKGAIVALDFAALEARVVLRTAGGVDPGVPDLYGAIACELGGCASRDAVKTCVLSLIFGAGRRSTAERLGTDGPEVDAFITLVGARFGFGALGTALTQLREEQGVLRNAFGRPLLMDGHAAPAGSLLVSHYVQATGVDVALVGFDIVETELARTAPRTRPLFVLHDALFLDVPLDELDAVKAMASVAVPGFDASFPLRFEIVRCDA